MPQILVFVMLSILERYYVHQLEQGIFNFKFKSFHFLEILSGEKSVTTKPTLFFLIKLVIS